MTTRLLIYIPTVYQPTKNAAALTLLFAELQILKLVVVLSGVLIATSVVAFVFVTCVTTPTQPVLLNTIGKELVAFSGKIPHCTEQWGIAGNTNGIYSLTYPISFTQSAYGVYCSENAAQDWGDGVAICGADTIRGTAGHVNLYTKWINPGGNIALGGESIAWIAIGR